MEEKWHGDSLTRLLKRAQSGDRAAETQFFELVNDELRLAAQRLVRNQGPDQPTSLVNEVFVRLFRKGVVDDLINRRYFFSVAIDQMRQILRERMRERRSQRRGGQLARKNLDVVLDQYLDEFEANNRLDFLALDEALERLKSGRATGRQYEAVKLHYLLGFQQKEISDLFGVDAAVVSKDLKAARAKLSLELGDA